MSKNIWADMGFADSEAMQTKANLVIQIESIMRKRNLSQVQCSRITGIPQSRVSNILKGDFESVSIERLVFAVLRLGCNVDIVVQELNKETLGSLTVRIAA